MKIIRTTAISATALLILGITSVPAAAQMRKVPAANYGAKCIRYDSNENKIHNNCVEALKVYWQSNNSISYNNSVTIQGGDYYPNGSRPTGGFSACLDLPQNRFDQEGGYCYYNEY